LEDAVEDVAFIRDLWEREYGRRNRSHNNPPTAQDIAAEFYELHTEDDLGALASRTGKNRDRK
jgi:hypothetical protein